MQITLRDCEACAKLLGIAPELVQTVAIVESRGDLTSYLFEPHVFHEVTLGRHSKDRPDISYPKWDRSKYPKTQALRNIQFRQAVLVEPLKAYEAASWGIFQIMGFNYKLVGFSSALGMSQALTDSVGANMNAFSLIVREMGLIETLNKKNWEGFAKRYNGPGYKDNNYHLKMASEYDRIISTQFARS